MPELHFFDDPGMDFAVRCVLSGVRYGMAEVGEVGVAVRSIADGDPESWLEQWVALGRRARSIGDRASAGGHRQSAWPSYLRAANYLFCGDYYAPATTDPGRAGPIWEEHRACWDAAVAHWPSPAEPVAIPAGPERYPGYWFPAPGDDEHRPVIIIVNGMTTPMSDTVMTGLADGLARGYHVVTFDGPGQGSALREHHLSLRVAWEEVVGSVLDWVEARPGTDPGRVALVGVDQGGWFAARAAAHDPRPAALVLDPGIVRLADDTLAQLPDDLSALYRTDPDAFDRAAASAVESNADLALLSGETRRPFRTASLRAALDALCEMHLSAAELTAISCPTYVASAEEAASYVGQPEELVAGLATDVTLDRFTRAEGAGLDCEILAPQIRNQRVFDWLDDTLRAP